MSTSKTGTEIFAAAARVVDEVLAEQILAEKDWRHKYTPYLTKLTEASLKSPQAALDVAKAGLEHARKVFRFVPEENPYGGVSLDQIASLIATAPLPTTTTVKGNGTLPECLKLDISADQSVSGADMISLLRKWADYGSAEQSVVESVTSLDVAGIAALQPLLQSRVFVLLGATSAMGPAETLLSLGATVVALSRPGAKMTTLVAHAHRSPGTLVMPILEKAMARGKVGTEPTEEDLWAVAGADIMEHLPSVIRWLHTLFPDKEMVVGSYIYLDGEAHVRASMAMDAIAAELLSARGGRVSLAYIGSPATAYVIDMKAYEDSARRYDKRPFWQYFLGFKKNNRPLVSGVNYEGKEVSYAVTDGFSVFQGPNYALAKALQLWRALLAWEAGRVQRSAGLAATTVSINMAPPCRTESVVHSKTAAVGIEGMSAFDPLLAFESCTVSGVMAFLLLEDLVHASTRAPLNNPLEIVVHNAFTGGGPRCAYNNESLGAAAYVIGLTGYSYKPE